MAVSPPAAPGRIFLSYRRDEADYPAGWLYERLVARFGRDQVFKDVDSIELGDDFAEIIADAVGACDVLLALIGRQWLSITDEAGNRRLDDPDDFVRLEIEAALERKVRVIPILVGNAKMPRAEQVPASLARLVRRQALELSPNRFESDTGRLLKVVDKTLAQAQTQREAEETAAREAAAKATREAEETATREAAAKATREAEETATREAAAKATREAEETATREAAAKATREAEETATREAAAKATREAAAKAKREAAAKATREAEETATREAAAKATREAEETATREAAAKANLPDPAGSRNYLGNRLGEAGQQPETRAGAPPAAEKASHPSMPEAPTEPARREDASRHGMPSIPPEVVDTPAGPPAPSNGSEPTGKQRRRLSTRARILAGVGVLLIPLLIVAIVARSNRTLTGTVITTPPPTGQVIFRDSFSTPTHGWNDAGNPSAVGRYNSGAYRISLNSDNTHAMRAPVKEPRVYPSAPQSVRVDVIARVPAGREGVGYGITCRTGQNLNSGYVFLMRPDYIEIGKTYDHDPWYKSLWNASLSELNVTVSTEYRLQAECASDEGQQAVRLAFWVNGGRGLQVIDRDDPFPTGTVGLIVATSPAVHTVEGEFDDFVVRQV